MSGRNRKLFVKEMKVTLTSPSQTAVQTTTRKVSNVSPLPKFTIEGDEFYVPENLLNAEVKTRERRIPLLNSISSARPPYLATCYDELSRNFMTVTVAPSDSLKPVPYQTDLAKSLIFPELDNSADKSADAETRFSKSIRNSRILHHYDPSFTPSDKCQSTQYVKYLGRQPYSDINILFKVKIKVPEAFEPLFGSLVLYLINGDRSVRLTETFHFDMTPNSVRVKFSDAYKVEDIDVHGCSENDLTIDAATAIRNCCFNLPSEYRHNDVFAVIVVTKVLVGDQERAVANYFRSSIGDSKNDETCKRLHMYRQSIGIGAIKILDDTNTNITDIKCPIFAVKCPLSDSNIAQIVKDAIVDNSTRNKNDLMNIEVGLKFAEVGKYLNSRESVPDGFLKETDVSIGGRGATSAPVEVYSHMCGSSNEASYRNWEGESLTSDTAELSGIRILNFLQPSTTSTPDHSYSPRRQVKYSVDHTLYLYPVSLEKFEHRNLCIKVQLVEIIGSVVGRISDHSDYRYLRNVYNDKLGPIFCSAAYSKVNYHIKSPTFIDEFKIRLPDVVTHRHFLKFTVQHVHVKTKTSTATGWGNLFGKQDSENNDICTIVGVGFMSLLQPEGCLISDKEYSIAIEQPPTQPKAISAEANLSGGQVSPRTLRSDTMGETFRSIASTFSSASCPLLRLRVKSCSSFVSTCPKVQTLLLSQPKTLGYLPSSIRGNDLIETLSAESKPPTIDTLTGAITNLQGASGQEMTNHFAVLVRILTRSLCGGTGIFSETLSNPYMHSDVRCYSFIMLLQLFSQLSPEVTTSSNVDDQKTPDEELLNSFIDYVFDEEIPLDGKSVNGMKGSTVQVTESPRIDAGISTKIRAVAIDDLGRIDTGVIFKTDEDSKRCSHAWKTDSVTNSDRLSTRFDSTSGSFYERLAKSENLGFLEPKEGALNTTSANNSFVNPSYLDLNNSLEKEQYTQYLATHFAAEVERIIIEDEFQKLVSSIAKEFSDAVTKLKVLTVDKKKTMQQFHIFSRKNIRVSGDDLPPFDEVSYWNDVYKNSDFLASLYQRAYFYPIHEDLVCVQIRKPHRYYQSLRSYAERSDDIATGKYPQWWPWMFEVISHQWMCLLEMYQQSDSTLNQVQGSSSDVNIKTSSYPFNPTSIPWSNSSRDIRILAVDYGPALLKIIMKSLILRIYRENKEAPIVLDKQNMFVLDRLFSLIAKEAGAPKTSLFQARRLTSSISHCLRSLFSVLVPYQVTRLVSSFLTVLNVAYRKGEELQIRIVMLQELCLFDHLIAANNISPLDAPLCLSKLRESASMNKYVLATEEKAIVCSDEYRSKLTENMKSSDAPPHWLADLIINICFSAFKNSNIQIQEKSVKLLREILVRHSFDARFQSIEARQRIALLYLPLLREIIKESANLFSKAINHHDRRELLVLLLFVLQDCPSHILREEIRQLCYQIFVLDDGSTSRPQSQNFTRLSSRFALSPTSIRSSARYSVDVGSSYKLDFPGLDADTSQLGVTMLIMCLNLVIDTFEFKTYNSPLLGNLATNDLKPGKKKSVLGKSTVGPSSDMTSKLNKLETMMQQRGTRKGSGATVATLGRSSSMSGGQIQTNTSQGVRDRDRKWVKNAEKLATHASMNMKKVDIGYEMYSSSLSLISHDSTIIVVSTLILIVEECPSGAGMTRSDETLADEVTHVIRWCLYTALHSLYCHQTQYAIESLLQIPVLVILKYGMKLFLSCVGDALQDYLRVIIRNLSYKSDLVRNATADWLIIVLQGCASIYGSVNLIADQMKAVLADSLDSILSYHDDKISSFEDEDEFVAPVQDAFTYLHDRAINSKSVEYNIKNYGYDSIALLMVELSTLFQAHLYVRHYLPNLVFHDWEGSNTLDGPVDEDVVNLLKSKRESRRVGNVHDDEDMNTVGINEVLETFLKASLVFDPVRLPRFRIRWLENMARLYDNLKSIRGENAVIRLQIYEVCKSVECKWEMLWSPRQPLDWEKGNKETKPFPRISSSPAHCGPLSPSSKILSSSSFGSVLSQLHAYNLNNNSNSTSSSSGNNRNFVVTLINTLQLPPNRPWVNSSQYFNHMELTLLTARKLFSSVGLCYLAEQSSHNLIDMYRKSGHLSKIVNEYNALVDSFQVCVDNGNSNLFSMGSYYWVQFHGLGMPSHFRGNEYIYRNNLHVSEFHAAVRNFISSQIADDSIDVKIPNHVVPNSTDLNSNDALIFITSVKPILQYPSQQFRFALNQAKCFQHSTPFTKDGLSHSKTMDEQWKRTVILSVQQPFPYLISRQRIIHKGVNELSPIEVAIDDIEERIESFQQELSLSMPVLNNLMRLIQGSVMPQVNAGTGEVARIFLSKTDPDGIALRSKLKVTLIQFLKLARLLIAKCREVMKLDFVLPSSNTGVSDDDSTFASRQGQLLKHSRATVLTPPSNSITDTQNTLWISEMEKAYVNLVNVVSPYLQEFVIDAPRK